jgi:hypothetical protein
MVEFSSNTIKGPGKIGAVEQAAIHAELSLKHEWLMDNNIKVHMLILEPRQASNVSESNRKSRLDQHQAAFSPSGPGAKDC